MFSEELELLIEAALADGTITEKERLILHKRAQAEGVDVDELDVIIEARLAKLDQSSSGSENSQRPPIKESITKELSRQLNEAQRKYERRLAHVDRSWHDGLARPHEEDQIENERDNTMMTIIRNFYVPNDRDHMLEFLLLCKQSYKIRDDMSKNSKYTLDNCELNAVDQAYIEKSRGLIDRAKSFFPQDKAMMSVIEDMERMERDLEKSNKDKKQKWEQEKADRKKKEKRIKTLKMWGTIGVVIVIFILVLIMIIAIENV